MSQFITLTQANGLGSITISIASILTFSDADRHGFIVLKTGDRFVTVETHDEILNLIQAARGMTSPSDTTPYATYGDILTEGRCE